MRFLIFPLFLTCACLSAQTAQHAPVQKPATSAPAVPKTAPGTAAPVSTAATAPNTVVLRVGSETMTRTEFESFVAGLPPQLRAQAEGAGKRRVAEQLLELKTLAQEARKRHLDQRADVKQTLALQTDNVLASALYKDLIGSATPDQPALQAYYDQHKQEFEQVKARHILIRTKGSQVPAKPGKPELSEAEALAKAQEIRKKLQGGVDFGMLAKEESDDTGSGSNGGSLGTFGHGQMVPPFEQAAFAMQAGQISEPVKTQFGYHIIKVDEHISKPFSEVKEQLAEHLKPELARKQMEELRKASGATLDDSYFGK